ncbi:unnamed protein product, partial [Oppiella nova]
MKKEWIMNEKEKQLRRTQIEKNRKFRQTISKNTTNGDKTPQTLNSDSDIDSIETLDDEKIIDYILDITNETTRRLSAFDSICLNDQIALVKYSCIEMQILRAALSYSHDKQYWNMDVDQKVSYVLTLDLIKNYSISTQIKHHDYEYHNLGINYCAITCLSCKSFFKRNAYNFEKQKCRFRDICVVNEKTRKHCIKCRLKKCFAVGMKREWLMNETEKQLRRTQIEMNRKSRQNAFKSTTTADKLTQTLNSDTDIDSIETLEEEKIIDYILDIAYDSNDKTINVNKIQLVVKYHKHQIH